MGRVRRQHGGEFKARVVLAALRGERPVNELVGYYEVRPTQIAVWKKRAIEDLQVIYPKRG